MSVTTSARAATVFLPTGFIGDSPLKFKDRDCLAWRDVRELAEDGVAFGSHTVTHPQLAGLGPEAISRELDGSKQAIEDRLGRPVTCFSYPYRFPEEDGPFKSRLGALLHDAGYTHGVTTVIGRAGQGENPLFLKRLPVNSADDLALFRAKLEGGYDWLHRPQYISKKVKMLMRAGAY